MNLIIDIGNTRTKLAVFDKNTIQDIQIFDSEKFHLEQILEQYSDRFAIVSSVRSLKSSIVKNFPSVLLFDKDTVLPISNRYRSEGVGMDRLASVVGASYIFSEQNCLIIDLGSAITIDFLTKDKIFLGGNISAGMNLRFKSLRDYTDKLPLVDSNGSIDLTSFDTETAIRSGVVKSIIYELEGYISEYEKLYPELKIILTGGDANFFEKQLKKRIFADENLVLKGLNRILNYNVDKK